jgi:ATP-binding cassette subfamily B protein
MKEIWKFLYPILKPYKHWYALMLLETIGRSINGVATIYALKLVVDAFGKGAIMYSELIYPIILYVGSMIVWKVLLIGH